MRQPSLACQPQWAVWGLQLQLVQLPALPSLRSHHGPARLEAAAAVVHKARLLGVGQVARRLGSARGRHPAQQRHELQMRGHELRGIEPLAKLP